MVAGEIGEELTENRQISTLSGNETININSAFRFSHPKDAPLYKVHWDFISIEGRSSSAGSFAELTEIGIQWDHKDSIYYHSDGTSTWEYRFRFRNSSLLTYSEYSPTVTGTGYDRNSLGYMLRQIRKIIQDKERKLVSDDEIIRFINQAQDIIQGVRPDWWFLRNTNSSTTTTAGTNQYALPSGVGVRGTVDTILYNFDDGTTNELYQLKFVPRIEFDYLARDQRNDDTIRDDYVKDYTIEEGDSTSEVGYYRVWPIPKTTDRGTFTVRYFEEMTDLDDVADETQVPIPALLEDYAIAMIEKIRGREEIAKVYEDRFWGPAGKVQDRRSLTGIALLEQLNSKQKRPQGQPRSLKTFNGRRALHRLFGNVVVDRDQLHEDFWN